MVDWVQSVFHRVIGFFPHMYVIGTKGNGYWKGPAVNTHTHTYTHKHTCTHICRCTHTHHTHTKKPHSELAGVHKHSTRNGPLNTKACTPQECTLLIVNQILTPTASSLEMQCASSPLAHDLHLYCTMGWKPTVEWIASFMVSLCSACVRTFSNFTMGLIVVPCVGRGKEGTRPSKETHTFSQSDPGPPRCGCEPHDLWTPHTATYAYYLQVQRSYI